MAAAAAAGSTKQEHQSNSRVHTHTHTHMRVVRMEAGISAYVCFVHRTKKKIRKRSYMSWCLCVCRVSPAFKPKKNIYGPAGVCNVFLCLAILFSKRADRQYNSYTPRIWNNRKIRKNSQWCVQHTV